MSVNYPVVVDPTPSAPPLDSSVLPAYLQTNTLRDLQQKKSSLSTSISRMSSVLTCIEYASSITSFGAFSGNVSSYISDNQVGVIIAGTVGIVNFLLDTTRKFISSRLSKSTEQYTNTTRYLDQLNDAILDRNISKILDIRGNAEAFLESNP